MTGPQERGITAQRKGGILQRGRKLHEANESQKKGKRGKEISSALSTCRTTREVSADLSFATKSH